MAEIVLNLDSIGISLAGTLIFDDLSWELQRRPTHWSCGAKWRWEIDPDENNGARMERRQRQYFSQARIDLGASGTRTVSAGGTHCAARSDDGHAAAGRNRKKSWKVWNNGWASRKYMEIRQRWRKLCASMKKCLPAYEQLEGTRYASKVRETLTALGLDASAVGNIDRPSQRRAKEADHARQAAGTRTGAAAAR